MGFETRIIDIGVYVADNFEAVPMGFETSIFYSAGYKKEYFEAVPMGFETFFQTLQG